MRGSICALSGNEVLIIDRLLIHILQRANQRSPRSHDRGDTIDQLVRSLYIQDM